MNHNSEIIDSNWKVRGEEGITKLKFIYTIIKSLTICLVVM